MKHRTSSTRAIQEQSPAVAATDERVNLAERCRQRVSPGLQAILARAAQTAEQCGLQVYAVGGFVRDVLLGVRDEDLDLTVEGDGVAFARHFAVALGGLCKGPSAFGTSVVVAPDGHKIDVATARRESYARPAALPTVEPGTLRDDLLRRDFSINTLAFALHGPAAFRLIDCCGGSADLAEGVIRVLHNRSFRDDPTRMLRAIRLEQRFGFILHRHTLLLLQRAVEKRWLSLLSGARLWRELRLMLAGESPVACLRRLDELGLLLQIDPDLGLSPERQALLTRVTEARVELAETHAEVLGQAWVVYLAALLRGLEVSSWRRVGSRLALAPRTIHYLSEALTTVERAGRQLCTEAALRPSQVVAALQGLPLEMLPLLLADCPERRLQPHIQHYLTTWRHVRPSLTGADLKRLGVPQSPQIGRLLARLLAAKLDGEASTRESEEVLIRGVLGQTSSS